MCVCVRESVAVGHVLEETMLQMGCVGARECAWVCGCVSVPEFVSVCGRGARARGYDIVGGLCARVCVCARESVSGGDTVCWRWLLCVYYCV